MGLEILTKLKVMRYPHELDYLCIGRVILI
jgi:hypothetical protein